MDKTIETIYDGIPIIPNDIKKMTKEELDNEWKKIVSNHQKANSTQ